MYQEKRKHSKYAKAPRLVQIIFEYGRLVKTAPTSSLFLKCYDDDAKIAVKTKAPTSRKEAPTRKKLLRKEPALDSKKSQPEKK